MEQIFHNISDFSEQYQALSSILAGGSLGALGFLILYLHDKCIKSGTATETSTFNNQLVTVKGHLVEEYIICAANHFDDGKEYDHQPTNIKTGFVVAGHRHHNVFTTLACLDAKHLKYENCDQGFITNTNRFVDRKEGAKVAYAAGQTEKLLTTLYSEDLY